MRKSLSILAITAAFSFPTATSAQITDTAPIFPDITPRSMPRPSAPGYYHYGDTRYMVLRSGGRLLSRVEKEYVDKIFTYCGNRLGSRIPEPNPGQETPIDMRWFTARFNNCIHLMLTKASEDQILPGDYMIMQSPIDNSDNFVVSRGTNDESMQIPFVK